MSAQDRVRARTGLTAEWAIAFQGAVLAAVDAHVPELHPRWPLQGLAFDAYAEPGLLVLFIHPKPQRVVVSGPGNPLPLVRDGLLSGPPTPELFHAWDAHFRARHSFGADTHVVLIPIGDLESAPRPEETWDLWPDQDRQLWNVAINAAVHTGLMQFFREAVSRNEAAEHNSPPINATVYEQHPSFEPPRDLDQPLWRYMSMTKFLSLLDQRALFFARADTLGDPWEGGFGQANARLRAELYGSETAASLAAVGASRWSPDPVFVSCWHAQDGESAAMWAVYAGWDAIRREGVAIRTTFRHLLESTHGPDKVFAGQVIYHDYETDFVPEDNDLERWMRKRLSFQHEREVRALISRFQQTAETPLGLLVPVTLDTLIQEVRVAPSAPHWFRGLVESVVQRFDLRIPVEQSSMDAEPLK